jgi:putative transposase
MRKHYPVGFWERLFKDIEEKQLNPETARRTLGLNKSTFYVKRRQYKNGGILPRKPGSGRKKIYHPKEYEPMIREILKDLPPVAGTRRIWLEMRKRGVKFSVITAYKILKELNLLVPKKKGRCRKKYKALQPKGPNDIWVGDTTTWWIGRQRVEIFICLDASSRYIPYLMTANDRTSVSTLNYYEKLFADEVPRALHTDNGPEFANKKALNFLEMREIEWLHGPSHTPEAQGLVERLVKTLKEEWLMWKEPSDIIEMQRCLEDFQRWYNERRNHSALDYKVPKEVYYAE